MSACDQYGNCDHFAPEEKPKGDLISREALKKELEQVRFAVVGFEGVLFIIDNAPTVERQYFPPCEDCHKKMDDIRRAYDKATARPQGEWLFKEITSDYSDYRVYGQCSICKQRKRIDKFCSNCGADMRGKKE